MKNTVRVTYSNAGLQPPVYVVTSLSEPQWEPVELQRTKKDNGEFEFYKDFEAEVGHHQYKFRLGPGDWWTLDESKQIVDDGSGNRNNLVVVEPPKNDALASLKDNAQPQKLETPTINIIEPQTAAVRSSEAAETAAVKQAAPPQPAEQSSVKAEVAEKQRDQPNTSVKSPTNSAQSSGASTDATKIKDLSSKKDDPLDVDENNLFDENDDEQQMESSAMLLTHETGLKHDDDETDLDDEPSHYAQDDAGAYEVPDDNQVAPLFRHESSALGPVEDHTAAPLFRHESMYTSMPDNHTGGRRSSTISNSPSVQSDTLDISENEYAVVEKLPSDHEGIMRHLSRASSRLPKDETNIGGTPPSPSIGSNGEPVARSTSNTSHGSLTHLNAIAEGEEESSVVPHSAQPQDSVDSFAAILAAAAADRDGKLDQLLGKERPQQPRHHHHAHGHKHERSVTGPTELLTPPMTPDMNITTIADEGRFESFPAAAQTEATIPETVEQSTTTSITDDLVAQTSTSDFISKSSTFESINKSSVSDSEREASDKRQPAGVVGALKGLLVGLGTWLASLCGSTGRATGVVAVAVGIAAAAYKIREMRNMVASLLLGIAYPYANGVRRDTGPGVRI